MAYQVIDAYGSVISIESSVALSGERQVVTIGSTLGAIPTTFSGNITIGSILSSNVPNQSVSGTVNIVGTASVQVISGTGVIGSITALQGTNPWVIGNSSVMLTQGINTIGSVATIQGTNPWVIGNSSVMLTPGINAIGSVATLQGTNPWITQPTSGSVLTIWSTPSIVGTYAEDTAHVDGQKGIFVLGVRNDGVASFASANLDYTPMGVDSAGRGIIKPFAPEEARIQSVISATAGTTSLLAAGGAGLRTYITDAFITNTSSTATIVSFIDGDNSVMGRTIAPATGGSNMVGLATPMRTGGFNHIIQVQMVPITSTLGVTALGFKAP